MLKSTVARPLARVLALGAVHLVLSLAMLSTVVMAQSDTTTYIIRPGDKLRQIAAAHNTTMQAILALNPGITNADQIYAGATILLPGPAEEGAEPGMATAVCPNTYTTVVGDTFTSIARKFNVDAPSLVVINHPLVVARLAVGTELCIPTAAVTGETQTSAPSDPTDVPEAGQGDGRWHTIQRGDYLSRIAGSAGCATGLLAQINNIANPSLVYSGQRIWIPASCLGMVTVPQPTAAPTPVPASVPFASVSAGWDHTCGMRTDGTVACWGKNDFGQILPPAGAFASVSAGWGHTCGLRTDGTLACWGRNDFGQALPPTGAFASVSAGWGHTCGLRTDGTLACWGRNNYGQALPSDGAFNFISSGWGHACGIRTDGTVACWGKNDFGQASPPDGAFISISAGGCHTCGMRADDILVCWGRNDNRQVQVPDGAFVAVSGGWAHTCGIRTNGTLACWGKSDFGQAWSPAGPFVAVSAGWAHTCGMRPDGTLTCWGDNYDGQASPPGGT